MRTNRSAAVTAVALGFLLTIAQCSSSGSRSGSASGTSSATAATAAPAPPPAPTAEHIKLQHILIAFAGKVPGKNVTRTQDEARALAHQILNRAKKGNPTRP